MGYRDARNFVTKERNKITSRQLSRCQTEKTFSVWIEFSLFNFSILNFEMRWSRVQPQTVNFRSILTLFVMHMRNFFSVSFCFFTKVSHDHFSPAIHWTIEEWIFRFCFHRSWLHRRWRRKPNKKLSSTSKLLLSFFLSISKVQRKREQKKTSPCAATTAFGDRNNRRLLSTSRPYQIRRSRHLFPSLFRLHTIFFPSTAWRRFFFRFSRFGLSLNWNRSGFFWSEKNTDRREKM